MADDIGI